VAAASITAVALASLNASIRLGGAASIIATATVTQAASVNNVFQPDTITGSASTNFIANVNNEVQAAITGVALITCAGSTELGGEGDLTGSGTCGVTIQVNNVFQPKTVTGVGSSSLISNVTYAAGSNIIATASATNAARVNNVFQPQTVTAIATTSLAAVVKNVFQPQTIIATASTTLNALVNNVFQPKTIIGIATTSNVSSVINEALAAIIAVANTSDAAQVNNVFQPQTVTAIATTTLDALVDNAVFSGEADLIATASASMDAKMIWAGGSSVFAIALITQANTSVISSNLLDGIIGQAETYMITPRPLRKRAITARLEPITLSADIIRII